MNHHVILVAIAGLLPAISPISAFPVVPVEEPLRGMNNSAMNASSGDDWDSWEAPESMRKSYSYYRSGYDGGGLVVYVMEIGSANYKDLSLRPKEYIDEFWKYYEQILQRVEFDAARNNDQRIVLLMDWDGFSIQNYASPGALQIALKLFTALFRLNNAVEYGIGINGNFVAQAFINLGRPFFGNMLDKFEFYGTRSDIWKPQLLRKIPADQLPPKYGGDKSWKPLPTRVTIP